MRDIGLIVSKNGPIPARLLSLAVETTCIARDRPRNRVAPQVWLLSGCRMALMCWGYHPPLGLHAHAGIVVEGPHALTFSGGLYHPTLEWAEEILQRLIGNGQPAQIFSALGGDGVMMYCDGARGEARVARTVAGGASLFLSDTDELFVAGTHALFVACVAQRQSQPSYDLDALAEFAVVRQFCRETTAFHGVKQAPIHSQISINQNGVVHVGKLSDDFESYGLATAPPASSDYDDLAETLVRGARRLAPDAIKSRVGVSGGKDSRLLLAVLLGAGVDVTPYCGDNYADHPDLIVGQQLLTSLGVPFDPPRILQPDTGQNSAEVWETRVDSLLQGELVNYGTRFTTYLGQPYNWEPFAFSEMADDAPQTIEWSGTAGELLKGGWTMPYWTGTFDPSLELMQEIGRRNVIGDIFFLSADLQRAAEQHWDEIWRWIYRPEVPLATLSRFYLDPYQARGGSFVTRAGTVYLYADSLMLRLLGRRFSVRSLQEDLPHFEVIRRLTPQIVDVPLANHRWCFEMDGPRPGDEAGYRQRAPVEFRRATSARNLVGYTNLHIELKSVFMEGVREAQRVLGDRLDFRRIWEIATTPTAFEHRYGSIFWALRTVYLLTSNRWLHDMEPARDPLRVVRFDLPWEHIYHDLLEQYRVEANALLAAFAGDDWQAVIEDVAASDGSWTPARHRRAEANGAPAAPRLLMDDRDLVVSLEHSTTENEILIETRVAGRREHTVWIAVPVLEISDRAGTSWALSTIARSDAAQARRADISLYPREGGREYLLEYDFASGEHEIETPLAFTVPAAAEGGHIELLLAMEPQVSWLTCRIARPKLSTARPQLPMALFADRCRTLAEWFRNQLNTAGERYGAEPQILAAELDRIRSLDPVWVDGVVPDKKLGLSAAQLLAFDEDAVAEVLAIARAAQLDGSVDIGALVLQPIHSLARYLALRLAPEGTVH